MVPWTHLSTKRHLGRFSRFRTVHGKESKYVTMGCPFSPQNCPYTLGDLDRYLKRSSLGQTESITQMASRSVQPFLQGSQV